ncbi:C40 family peptidase, partial [Escherichia coli]|uniref:C40 family peptidase n=1 Tax=Escherichia coli TaxID=562 RepID=UPI00398A0C54
RCAPAESCGFVVRAPEGERYFPCVNISGEPEDYFRMAPEDWLQAEMQGEIVALVHSHPGGLPWLSEADRRLQVKWSTKTGHRVRVFSSIDFPIRLVVT